MVMVFLSFMVDIYLRLTANKSHLYNTYIFDDLCEYLVLDNYFGD